MKKECPTCGRFEINGALAASESEPKEFVYDLYYWENGKLCHNLWCPWCGTEWTEKLIIQTVEIKVAHGKGGEQ